MGFKSALKALFSSKKDKCKQDNQLENRVSKLEMKEDVRREIQMNRSQSMLTLEVNTRNGDDMQQIKWSGSRSVSTTLL